MKLGIALLALLCLPALAQNEPSASSALKPKHTGYAVKHPNVLIHQVLFGRAHGVALLAAACDADTPIGKETRSAYAKWHQGQIHAIAKMSHDLARWYFTSEAQQATDADIVSALNLKPRLDPNLSATELKAACETFPQMLQSPRYDLATLMTDFSSEAAAMATKPKSTSGATSVKNTLRAPLR